MTARSRPAVLAALATTGLLAAGLTPAHAAVLDDHSIEGVQFVTADCARNEYVVDATVTGTTDDVGGFDRFVVRVWDDGTIKDSRTAEVPVGATQDLTVFLSFMGLYGTGAPGVGIEILDVDGVGTELGQLSYDDPFFPDEQDGYCAFDIERIGGADRIETAALLSSQKFVSADTAFLATSTTYPDALTAAPAAAYHDAPLLLTRPGSLPAATAAELVRLGVSDVVIVGGEASVSATVRDQVEAALPAAQIHRVGGADRSETAAMLTEWIEPDSTSDVYLASGQDFPDALVLSALAARSQAPLLLTRSTSLPPDTMAALTAWEHDELYLAGGLSVVSQGVQDQAAAVQGAGSTRYAGADRYATAALVLEQFPAEGRVLVATGEQFPDALTAVPVAARTGAGIALTEPAAVPAPVLAEIERLVTGFPFPLVTIVGGPAAVHPTVEAQLTALMDGLGAPADRVGSDTSDETGNRPSR